MKRLFTFLAVALLAISLTACGETAEKEITNVAVYEDFQLELGDAEIFTNDDGQQMVRVHAVYTNNSEDGQYALSCFVVKGFQNDTEVTDYSDINGDEAALIQEVKNGASLDVSYVFELPEESEFEVVVGTPTADEETIGRQVYFQAEE